MNRRNVAVSGLLAGLAATSLSLVAGCSDTVWRNLTKERTGNISMQFINNTRYRAAFSFGTWDASDRTPGPVTLQQLRVPANTSSTAATVPCRRNAAVGTKNFVDRVVATKTDQTTTTFDPDSFDKVVHFSAAASDSDAAALPTAGTALGVEKLLGVDYSCADLLIFTFWEDPDAEGGFRVDYEVVLDQVQQ
jgi:hypothetical protein